MPLKRTTQVIKVPLPREYKFLDRPQSFPRMPRLYLELMENKNKIKQELVNKEYVPQGSPPPLPKVEKEGYSIDLPSRRDKDSYEKFKEDHLKLVESTRGEDKYGERRDDRRGEDRRDDRRGEDRRGEDRRDGYSSDEESVHSKRSYISNDTDNNSERRTPQSGDEVVENQSDSEGSQSGREEESDDLSDRLKHLLNETDEDQPPSRHDTPAHQSSHHPTPRPTQDDKYSRKYTPISAHRSVHRSAYKPYYPQNAPTLKELEAQGAYKSTHVLPDMGQPQIGDEELQDSKRELLFKFDLLRKSYPSATIPEFSMHADYMEMQKTYDSTVRRLTLDSNVENYKQYLIYGFMGVEFVMGNFLGFDMQGFTQQQILSMNTYEKLLIELGEKSYVPKGSKWPVELRLVFTIIMNAAVFIVGKMIMRKTGANLMGMLNSMNTSSAARARPAAKKRKMRGPNIDLDDLPDMDVENTQREF